MNIKRIIGCEGLIIMAISLSFVTVAHLNNHEQYKKDYFEQKATIAEVVEKSGKAEEQFKGTSLYIMLQKPTDLLKMNEILKKDFPKLTNPGFIEWEDQPRSVSISRYYDNDGNEITFRDYDLALFILLYLYPAYLIVRFIIWAIKIPLQ